MAASADRRSPQVDVYIAKSPAFAQPILNHLRELFHRASPLIQEEIKWGCPHFVHKGIVGGVAAFKQHVGLGFWKSKLMKDPAGLFSNDPKASMCSAKIRSLDELPGDKVFLSYVREAVALNEDGVKLPMQKKARPTLPTPAYLRTALKSNPAAAATFAKLAPSHRRDYIEWLIEAKTDATRQKRLATTLEWLAAGKRRNWKYERAASASPAPRAKTAAKKENGKSQRAVAPSPSALTRRAAEGKKKGSQPAAKRTSRA